MDDTAAPNATASNNDSMRNNPLTVPVTTQLGWILGILVTHVILSVFITFSNLIVLAAFYKNPKLRTTTNLVIISMATADLLVGCLVLPLWLYTADMYFMIGPPFQKWQNTLFTSYTYIDQILALISVFHLVLLHGLRSYSIAFPLRHRQLNNRPVIILCLFVWAVCIAVPPVMRELLFPKSCTECIAYCTLVLNIGLPLLLLTVANLILWRSVAKSSRARQKKVTKILINAGILIGILCVFVLPFLIASVIVTVANDVYFNFDLRMVLKFLYFSNSAINPPVYAFRHPEIGRTLKAIFFMRTSRDVVQSTRTRVTNNVTVSHI